MNHLYNERQMGFWGYWLMMAVVVDRGFAVVRNAPGTRPLDWSVALGVVLHLEHVAKQFPRPNFPVAVRGVYEINGAS